MEIPLKKGKLYKVTWHDIHHDNEWTDLLDIYEIPDAMQNYWVYIDEIGPFYIFTTGGDATQYFDVIKVPKGCVIGYERIRTITKRTQTDSE